MIEAQPRWKNGQPPQSTTGVASTSCTQVRRRPESRCDIGAPTTISAMAMNSRGAIKTRLIQNRRVMSTSSGLTSVVVTVRGSSAMPQMGQKPGSSRTIWGCIGQVYSVRVIGAGNVTGSKAMPHFGQAPGLRSRTSGCIGQV